MMPGQTARHHKKEGWNSLFIQLRIFSSTKMAATEAKIRTEILLAP